MGKKTDASGKSLRLKIKLPKAAESPSHGDGVWEPTQEKRVTRQRKDKRKRGKAEDDDYEMMEFGEEADVEDLDELESQADEGGNYYTLGQEDEQGFQDFTSLVLKDDCENRPLTVCPDGRIFLETFSPVYKRAYDFMIAVAEPVGRPELIHEYALTPHSLYAAVSVGLDTETIITVLNRLSKVELPPEIRRFVEASTGNYGKVKLVLQHNKFFVESPYPEVLKELLDDEVIQEARVHSSDEGTGAFLVSSGRRDLAAADLAQTDHIQEADEEALREVEGGVLAKPIAEDIDMEDPGKRVHSFEIDATHVEHVKQRCLPGGLNYPMLEEYDFQNDFVNAKLDIELKPHVRIRPYQEKSMQKMFGNGRARSGIIVLPCGAGKSLTGISAAARIKKSCLVLCTNAVSVDQWRHQFMLWTNLQEHQVGRFTSEQKEMFKGLSGVTVTTYTMVAFTGKRSEQGEAVLREIAGREWGLLLLDEVHVVPAQMFRKVIGIVKAHCKLGLTATLVREDARISDLNFLIGPKLYEANWLDLTRAGHIANVQCAEVWCPMTREFFREYLKKENAARQQLLYVMNPNKFRACQFLIQYHESPARRDKVIVFSDNIFALREYATKLKKPFIYGGTGHAERTRVLNLFRTSSDVNTVFLSKVGDNSIDIPEANVLIQISSHAGSRRQEAQRLGRILRAKAGVRSGPEEYNAFFYTLVSKDTTEMYYSTKRQQFLIDQGYSFHVVTNLVDDNAAGAELEFSSQKDQLDLLARCLHAGEEDAGEEEGNAFDVEGVRPAARRTAGSMAALSGAHGRMYMEYSTGAGGRGRGRGRTQHTALFKQALRNK